MILIASGLWLVAILMIAFLSSAILTNIVAFFVVIVLPGTALAYVLIPWASDLATRVMASVGFGLSLAILVAIVFNYTPFGIESSPIVLVGMAVLGVLGLVRMFGRDLRTPSITSRQVALLGLGAVLSVSAFGLARISVAVTTPSELTQLWLLPGSSRSVEVGVANLGQADETYRLVLRSDAGDIREWPELELPAGQRWSEVVTVAAPPTGNIDAFLYRADLPDQVFRRASVSTSVLEE